MKPSCARERGLIYRAPYAIILSVMFVVLVARVHLNDDAEPRAAHAGVVEKRACHCPPVLDCPPPPIHSNGTVLVNTKAASADPSQALWRKDGTIDNDLLIDLVKKHLMPYGDVPYAAQFRVVNPRNADLFAFNEKKGVHILPVHFYSAIPPLFQVNDTVKLERTALAGVDVNEQGQLEFVKSCTAASSEFVSLFGTRAAPKTGPAVDQDKRRYTLDNPSYRYGDAVALWCVMRTLRPRRVVELGSGFTTMLMGEAAVRNAVDAGGGTQDTSPAWRATSRAHPPVTRLTSYDPHFKLAEDPTQIAGLDSLRLTPAQDLQPNALAESLGAGDVLFVDTSHVMHFASDVRRILLELIPALPVGVLVHIHDIFLPNHYPRAWAEQSLRFWNEQYMVHAFLVGNTQWEVVYMCSWFGMHHKQEARAAFGREDGGGGGCLWMRRVQ